MAGKIATWTDVSAKGYGRLADSAKWKKCPKKSEIKNFGCYLNSTGEGYADSRMVPKDYILGTSSLFKIDFVPSILHQGTPENFILDGNAATSFSDSIINTLVNCGMIPDFNSCSWNTTGYYNTSIGYENGSGTKSITNNGSGHIVRYLKNGTPDSSLLIQVVINNSSIYFPMVGSQGRLYNLYGIIGFKASGMTWDSSVANEDTVNSYRTRWFGSTELYFNGPGYITFTGKPLPCYQKYRSEGILFNGFILEFQVQGAVGTATATSSLDEPTYEEVLDGSIYRIEPLYDENGPIVSPFAPEPPQALLEKDPSVFDIEDPISGEVVGTVEIRTISWEELYGDE